MDATVNGTRLHVAEDGPRDGTPIVLIHGLGGDLSGWAHQIAGFAAAYRLVRIDLPGHGGSASPDDDSAYDLERQARLVVHLLDQLAIDRAHVMGYDLGGVIAQIVALEYPGRLRALVLIGTSPETLPDLSPRGIGAAPTGTEDRLRTGHGRAAAALQRFPGVVQQLQIIGSPTLVIVGDADAPYLQRGAELLHGWIPFSRLVRIPDTAHTPHQENPAAFNAEVLGFLREVETAG